MKYSEIPVAQTVLLSCLDKGIRHVVISPGSRNAPLTLSFTAHPDITAYSIVDERCAAFFALGIAQQIQQPVAVICSSGSALLNYYPAIAEAFYSNIPLVVLSADRPVYRIDIGDGQTIRQDHVFDRHLVYSAPLQQDVIHHTDAILQSNQQQLIPVPYQPEQLAEMQQAVQTNNASEIHQALSAAIEHQKPVHINIPMEEPLYNTIDKPTVALPVFSQNSKKKTVSFPSKAFSSLWNRASKKMILVGCLSPNTLSKEILDQWAADPSIIVLTETTSNLHHAHFISSIDTLIAPIEFQSQPPESWSQLRPDMLITVGGMIVSKKIKTALRNYPPQQHFHVGEREAYDTFYQGVLHEEVNPTTFFRTLPKSTVGSDYRSLWLALQQERTQAHERYMKKTPFSDLKVFEMLLARIPDAYHLQIGNSSSIRYMQLFNNNPTHTQFCNRGTSGIDGSTSTAVGASVVNKTPTLLVSGDLSFLYDSNGLWNTHLRNDFRIVVINNGGGGIFRILPGAKADSTFATFFETQHTLTAKQLARMHGFRYQNARSQWGLKRALSSFFKPSSQPKLLEIFTPTEKNADLLKNYFKFLAQ